MADVSEQLTCRRCSRVQIFNRQNWKSPHAPQLHYRLDEVIFQFLNGNSHLPLLALNHLQQDMADQFPFSSEIEFYKKDEKRPSLEVDLLCIRGSELIIGEAKSVDRLE